ncbi:MAG: peptidylprolyl isomerase [Deltaproteobacteria bacterium]|nr:peptidylprolyl isomerase [Deltaproteobacteria bacterium]
MEIISQDKFVRLEYRLRLKSGEYLRGEPGRPAHLSFIAGCGEVLPGLERRLWGLPVDDRVEFVVPAAEAFGAYDPDNVQVWTRKVFPAEMELAPGQKVLPAELPFPPEYPLTIKEVQGERVILDLNHPLADQDLYYEVRVLEVRPATAEELTPLKQCQACREESMQG